MIRILVVDDQDEVREGLAEYLETAEVELVVAAGPEEAKAALREGGVDLVLSDLRMSSPAGEEGLDLLDFVRSEQPAVPFVLMTAFASPEVEARAERAGAHGFLPNTLDFGELDRLVEELLRDGPEPTGRISDERGTALLERWVRSGDEQVFNQIVASYRPMICAVAGRWYGLSPEQVDEVFQDTMLHLLSKAREIRNVRRWLIGTAVNLSRRKIGGVVRHRRIAEGWAQEEKRKETIDISAEEDLREVLWAAVATLPPRQRELVELLYRDGLSYDEIAEKLGMPLGSIGPTRGRIVRKLLAAIRGMERGLGSGIGPTSH